MIQNDKKSCPLHFISQEPYIICLSFMVHICKIISSGIFFYFSKILIFWVHRGIKGQQMVQNDKKFCLLHSISQKPYTRLSFMVQVCKIIISPGVFFQFKKFWFSGLSGSWKGKKWPKMTKSSACLTPYLRIHTSCNCDFW